MKLNKKVLITILFFIAIFLIFSIPTFAVVGDYDLISEDLEFIKNSSPEKWKDTYESYDYHIFLEYKDSNMFYIWNTNEPAYYCRHYRMPRYILSVNSSATSQLIEFNLSSGSFRNIGSVMGPGVINNIGVFEAELGNYTFVTANYDIYKGVLNSTGSTVTSDNTDYFFQLPLERVGLLPVEEIVPTQVQEVIRQTLKTIIPIAIMVFSALLLPYLIRWWAYHHQ